MLLKIKLNKISSVEQELKDNLIKTIHLDVKATAKPKKETETESSPFPKYCIN